MDEVLPSHGPAIGGTSVKIFGHNLSGATAVDFGQKAATSFSVVSDAVVDAVSPGGTGNVNVRVVTPAGKSAADPRHDHFTYDGPIVNEVIPNHGPLVGGTTVQIIGHNLTGATAVDFGPNAATSVTVVGDSRVTAVSPAGTGVVNVRVITPSGESPATPRYDAFAYIGPNVTEVIPNHGPTTGGTAVRIVGHNLTGATAVDFGTTAATSFSVVSDAVVDAVSPVGTGVVDVRVMTPSGETAIRPADHFTYVSALPIVTEVIPNKGPAVGGTSVQIVGHNFTGATVVDFGTTAATSFSVVSDAVIDAVSPAGTGVVNVRVTTPPGESAVHPLDDFTYKAAVPTVNEVDPNNGPVIGGTSVQIFGHNFTGTTVVDFGTTPATSFSVVSDAVIDAVSPAGTGVVNV
ncbi:MAG: IPT/TIG domain-containing protein, partial [Acidimicrobiales bacterium]